MDEKKIAEITNQCADEMTTNLLLQEMAKETIDRFEKLAVDKPQEHRWSLILSGYTMGRIVGYKDEENENDKTT